MRAAVTVSLVPEAIGGPFVFREDIDAAAATAAELGFHALEIFPPDAATLREAALPRRLAGYGLAVAAVGTGGGWVRQRLSLTSPDASQRAAARQFVAALIDAAGELAAPAIIGSLQGAVDHSTARADRLGWLGEALVELGARARQHGRPLLLEPLNRYESNLCNQLGSTAAWLRSLGAPDVRLLADLFHAGIEESDTPAALRACGDLIGHVHFADSNRRAIGFGQTAVGPIVAALRDIGYSGYLSAEILPLPNPYAAAAQTMAAYRQAQGSAD